MFRQLRWVETLATLFYRAEASSVMHRVDVFVKKSPSMHVEEGLAHVQFYSGDVAFEFVMSMHTFKRAMVDADRLYQMWDAAKGEVIPFEAVRRGQSAAP